MSLVPNDWIKEDFLALVLDYAAHADLEISSAERAYMKNLCGEAHCEKAAAFNEAHSDYDVVQVLADMKEQFFPGAEGTSQLTQHLLVLFHADHDYSHLEHSLMRGLQRLW
ncbi:MAG: hypothetical protein DA408_08950 [Bacteroidetes bacterium]|nr:MAG: hypothetical protein C7N36_18690 [Bacteroidota bacterium]PTM12843.1 MAG: hypothetical protein DA408_08950 [Bacteroidota bacterium]